MLEHLAGPFAIHDSDGGAITLSPISGSVAPIIWDDDVGLIGYAASGSFTGYAVVQLDGLAYLRANLTIHGPLIHEFPSANLLAMASIFRDALFAFDKASGVVGDPVLGIPYPVTGYTAVNYVHGLGARVTDRYLQVINGLVKWTSLTDPTSPATEYTFTGSLSGWPQFSPTRFTNVVCLIWPAGTVAYYDWVQKTEVFARQYLPANHGAWFSPRLGIFVVLDASNQINVYATTVRPYALSNPAAVTPFARGKVSDVTVTLTGSNGEPCPNEVIEWSMTGDGALTAAQSTTDSAGVARNRYVASLTPVTDPTITATARF